MTKSVLILVYFGETEASQKIKRRGERGGVCALRCPIPAPPIILVWRDTIYNQHSGGGPCRACSPSGQARGRGCIFIRPAHPWCHSRSRLCRRCFKGIAAAQPDTSSQATAGWMRCLVLRDSLYYGTVANSISSP